LHYQVVQLSKSEVSFEKEGNSYRLMLKPMKDIGLCKKIISLGRLSNRRPKGGQYPQPEDL
jgi:hypothetical protein